MQWNVQVWIESVKGKSEHIRKRYVVGCVMISMFFIVIVWSLTVTQIFQGSQKKDIQGKETASSLFPKAANVSIDDVLKGIRSIGDTPQKTGQEFLREQQQNQDRLKPNDEGIMPKDERAQKKQEAVDAAAAQAAGIVP